MADGRLWPSVDIELPGYEFVFSRILNPCGEWQYSGEDGKACRRRVVIKMDRQPLSTAAKVVGDLVSEDMLLAVGPGGSDIWLLSADASAEPGMWVTVFALD